MAKPVHIVTGFLGCGKTSFLRHLLPMCGEVGVRPALIINEVGDVDVDGELLADLQAEQARLVGGCVCCTLQGMLTETLYDVLERDAGDVIIIECSGLSNPLDVLGALSAPALLKQLSVSHIVCLLDASRAEAILSVVELAKEQVAAADVLILNKVDKMAPEKREKVTAKVETLAARAGCHWASYGDIGAAALRHLLTDVAPTQTGCCCEGGCDHDHAHTHQLPASFCTVALPLPATLRRPALEALLRALPENVIRAKGFAFLADGGWHVLQRVFDAVDLTELTGPAPSIGAMLVCIGQHLDADLLRTLVAEAEKTAPVAG